MKAQSAVNSCWLTVGRAAIFGDDDEGALDRIYASHRELFERGVLPDYWFVLLSHKQGAIK